MRQPRFPIQLHLLIHASPLGVAPTDSCEEFELDALAARGLLRPRPSEPTA